MTSLRDCPRARFDPDFVGTLCYRSRGGWDQLPAEWQETPTPRGLYTFLVRALLADPDLSLQELLHDRIHLQLNALCEEMLPYQPHPVQVIYRITKDEDLAGRMVLLALPKTPNTTFTIG